MNTEVITDPQISTRLANILGVDRSVFYQSWKGGGKANENAFHRHLYIYCMVLFSGKSKKGIARMLKVDPSCINKSMDAVYRLCSEVPAIKTMVIKIEGELE